MNDVMNNYRLQTKSLVSCVLIFLNAERFIEEAIRSVFAQTYNNWELLIVDDGSNDRSTAIALSYADSNRGKVMYLEHKGHRNHGISASRNLGMRHATGEYIVFLDADDVFFKEKLQQQVPILEMNQEAAAVFGNTETWFSWTGKAEDLRKDFVPDLGHKDNFLYKPALLANQLLRRNGVPCIHSFLIRRQALLAVGGFEDAFTGLYEDQVLYAKLFLNFPVIFSTACLEKYRQHSSSCLNSSQYLERKRERLNFLNWMEQYLTSRTQKGTIVWRTLQRELLPYRHPVLSRLLNRKIKLSTQTTSLLNSIKRKCTGEAQGSLDAIPNPVPVPAGMMEGITTLSWVSKNVSAIEVRVGSPDGPLFSCSHGSGAATTGQWVSDGTVFYLQDVSSGKQLTRENTLDTVTVRIHTKETDIRPRKINVWLKKKFS